MINLTCEIGLDLVGALEDHLCEWEDSPWAIVTNCLTGEGLLKGYFVDRLEGKKAWASLRDFFAELPEEPIISTLEDQDWKEAYKQHFKPWQKGSFHLVPTWEKESYAVPFGHKALYLDPDMAFGTGNHETTRLCLNALSQFLEETTKDPANLSCVDAGCGSGILALAAKLLGFGVSRGFDLDPDAVRIAGENAVANGLSEAVNFSCADISTALHHGCTDLLLANLQADVLSEHRVALLTALRPFGTLSMSGLLSREADELECIFINQADDLKMTISSKSYVDGEWAEIRIRSNC